MEVLWKYSGDLLNLLAGVKIADGLGGV